MSPPPPSPLSALCAANDVAVAIEAGLRGEIPFEFRGIGAEQVGDGRGVPRVVELSRNFPHRARARMGLRCLTVRVGDRTVRHLISTGYLSLERREEAAAVAIALEAWIYDNVT